MNVDVSHLEKYVYEYYKKEDFVLTKRIVDRLVAAICSLPCYKTGELAGMSEVGISADKISDFLGHKNVKMFIEERQPYIEPVADIVTKNIQNYFEKECLPYKPIVVYRKSNHRDDKDIYTVIAEGYDGKFACWTTWNDKIQSLNHGNYGLEVKKDAEKILSENFFDITDEPEKYGMEQTERKIEKNDEQIAMEYRRRRGR